MTSPDSVASPASFGLLLTGSLVVESLIVCFTGDETGVHCFLGVFIWSGERRLFGVPSLLLPSLDTPGDPIPDLARDVGVRGESCGP